MKTPSLFIIILIFGCSLYASAQPGNPSSPAPIGFIEVLALGGFALAFSKKSKR